MSQVIREALRRLPTTEQVRLNKDKDNYALGTLEK